MARVLKRSATLVRKNYDDHPGFMTSPRLVLAALDLPAMHHPGRVLGAEGVGVHGAFGDQANGAQHLDPYEAAMRF